MPSHAGLAAPRRPGRWMREVGGSVRWLHPFTPSLRKKNSQVVKYISVIYQRSIRPQIRVTLSQIKAASAQNLKFDHFTIHFTPKFGTFWSRFGQKQVY